MPMISVPSNSENVRIENFMKYLIRSSHTVNNIYVFTVSFLLRFSRWCEIHEKGEGDGSRHDELSDMPHLQRDGWQLLQAISIKIEPKK